LGIITIGEVSLNYGDK